MDSEKKKKKEREVVLKKTEFTNESNINYQQ